MDIQACIVMFCICVVTGETVWVDKTVNRAYEIRKSENLNSWWDAANQGCATSDGHLFVPEGKGDEGPVINLIDEQKVYWVGGFQYSYLKWTEDNTRYHTRVGYIHSSYVTNVSPVTLRNNSAFSCDLSCGYQHRVYGLQGTSCYCLGYGLSSLQPHITADYTIEIRCPGDYDERCGNDRVVTIYRKDPIDVYLSRNGKCAYVKKVYWNRQWHQTYFLDGNCDLKRLYVCADTVDSTRYHTRVGYIYSSYVTNVSPVTLRNNSAFSCDLSCGYQHRVYGLQGTSCYCLGNGFNILRWQYHITEESRSAENQCTGDSDEWCGNYWGMTIYRKDCTGNMCVELQAKTWKEAQSDCVLAKPNVTDILYYLLTISHSQIWIGLDRTIASKWINGKQIESNSDSYYLDRQCLGVWRDGSSLNFNWYDCRGLFPALCNTVKRESTPLIGESTSTVQPSTKVIGASTQVVRASTQGSTSVTIFPALTGEPTVSTPTDFSPTDSTPTSGERTTSHHVKGFVNKGTDKGEDHPAGFPVIYIVGAGGVLAVGIVITLVLVFLKRQRRYCFKLEVEREDGVHYDRSVENLSYSPAGPGSQSAAREEAHPSPARTEKNARMSTKKSNIPNENTVSNTGVKQDESVYNVPDETSPTKPSRTGHLSVRKDTAADPSDKEACFEDEGQYNVLHGKVFARGSNSGMYAHFGQGEGDVEYDTTRHVQNTVRLNDTYNHIGPSKEPIADDDDQYNVLRRERSQSAADGSTGIYDHITTSADQLSKVPAVQGPSKQVVDDIYSHVDGASKRPKQDKLDTVMEVKEYKLADTKNIGKAGVDCGSAGVSSGNNTDHVYGNTREIIGPCNRPRCVEDEADYYNIDSVRKSKLASTSKEDEEVGNNVYSLAHEFSDK